MPGFEIFGDEERKEVQDVLDTGVLFIMVSTASGKGTGRQKHSNLNWQNESVPSIVISVPVARQRFVLH